MPAPSTGSTIADRPMTCHACKRIKAVSVERVSRSGLGARNAAFDAQTEPRPHIGAERAAAERGGDPKPAVHARRRDAAEIGADIAAISKPRTVTEQQPAQHGGDERTRRHFP